MRLITDPSFATSVYAGQDRHPGSITTATELTDATTERLRQQKQAGRLRDDVPSDVLHTYLDLVLDGLVARLATAVSALEDERRDAGFELLDHLARTLGATD